jgi:hypothetical protein
MEVIKAMAEIALFRGIFSIIVVAIAVMIFWRS